MGSDTEKTCRYGHGELVAENGLWAMPGIDVKTDNVGVDTGQTAKYIVENGLGFSLRIYKCPTCGYLEFFDK